MNYAQWPRYVQKKYGLTKTSIGGTVSGSPSVSAETAIKWLYDVLTTLDAKASALMRLNGVLIAAAAFLLGLFGRLGNTILATTMWDARVIISCALFSAASIFACLFVVNVSWSFLGKTNLSGTDGCDCTTELRDLGDACGLRQVMYRLAWWISFCASIGFFGEFFRQTLHIFMTTPAVGVQ